MSTMRTHMCGELRTGHVGGAVRVAGWVQRRRDLGGLIFLDLRDREGVVQVVINPEQTREAGVVGETVRAEFVVAVDGTVERRPDGTVNPRLATGEIEVRAKSVHVVSTALTPPFSPGDEGAVDEALRLKYRFLDLRRPKMFRNLLLRHRASMAVRESLDRLGFVDVETPLLIRSTPEGARDFIVPSRLHPGRFYALPQSPQLLKQLLMVAGIDRYFQIARCFRDEDLRADRQPEFTQLDLEMSFVDQDDVLDVIERLFTSLTVSLTDFKIDTPFPRLTYSEAMDRYGNDKPDLRFGVPIVDLSEIARTSSLGFFRAAVESGGVVRAIAAPGAAEYSRRQLSELEELAKSFGAG